jgi:hypothetical protein
MAEYSVTSLASHPIALGIGFSFNRPPTGTPVLSTLTFTRPHDPPHLHTFSLLI